MYVKAMAETEVHIGAVGASGVVRVGAVAESKEGHVGLVGKGKEIQWSLSMVEQ